MSEFYFTGKDLIDMGFEPGPRFATILKEINVALNDGKNLDENSLNAKLAAILDRHKAEIAQEEAQRLARRKPLLSTPIQPVVNITAENPDEAANVDAVLNTMETLGKTPTLVASAVMPDACPAGSIPVGGVAGARNAIHPGWHSADICCSMMATNFGDVDPKTLLDVMFEVTHFGPGGRPRHKEIPLTDGLIKAIFHSNNPFFAEKKAQDQARSHMGTQGDGLSYAA